MSVRISKTREEALFYLGAAAKNGYRKPTEDCVPLFEGDLRDRGTEGLRYLELDGFVSYYKG